MSVTTTAEWELIQRCQAGAAAAFEPLVRTHQGPALGYATALLGDADEAADALQDAFVLAYRSLRRLRPGSPFGPWFRTIVRNVCLDRLRSPRLQRRVTLDSDELDAVAWADPSAVGSAERGELQRIMGELLQTLPPELRAAILLREVEGLSYVEIATRLGIPTGTVASRLNHARTALKRAAVSRGVTLEDVT